MRVISQIVEAGAITAEISETFSSIKDALNAPFISNYFRVRATSPHLLNGIWPAMNHIPIDQRPSRATV